MLATAVACGAIVALAGSDDLDLLWVVVGADLTAALALATTIGLASPLAAERAVLTGIFHGGGLVALAQLVVGVLAAPLARVPDEPYDWGWFAVPLLAVLLVALVVPCVLLAWWLVVLPLAALTRRIPAAVRGDGRALLEVLFSLLLLAVVALAVTQTGARRWDWPDWPAAVAGTALVLTVGALAAFGYLVARRRTA